MSRSPKTRPQLAWPFVEESGPFESDWELIQKTLDGDEEAWGRFYGRHLMWTVRLCEKVLGPDFERDAEDAAEDAFDRMRRYLGRVRTSPRGYLMRCVDSACAECKKGSAGDPSDDDPADEHVYVSADGPDHLLPGLDTAVRLLTEAASEEVSWLRSPDLRAADRVAPSVLARLRDVAVALTEQLRVMAGENLGDDPALGSTVKRWSGSAPEHWHGHLDSALGSAFKIAAPSYYEVTDELVTPEELARAKLRVQKRRDRDAPNAIHMLWAGLNAAARGQVITDLTRAWLATSLLSMCRDGVDGWTENRVRARAQWLREEVSWLHELSEPGGRASVVEQRALDSLLIIRTKMLGSDALLESMTATWLELETRWLCHYAQLEPEPTDRQRQATAHRDVLRDWATSDVRAVPNFPSRELEPEAVAVGGTPLAAFKPTPKSRKNLSSIQLVTEAFWDVTLEHFTNPAPAPGWPDGLPEPEGGPYDG